MLHVVRETDAGIVVRGAKFETAAAYANQALREADDRRLGRRGALRLRGRLHRRMGAPGMKHICRSGFAGRAPVEDYPLTNRFDEVDTLIVFDDVEIPWEDVFFYRHTRAAAVSSAHPAPLQRVPVRAAASTIADMLIGAALWNVTPDRPGEAAGGAREARRARVLPRGHQCAPDRRDRARRAQPRRAADAEPVAALHRPRVRLLATCRR